MWIRKDYNSPTHEIAGVRDTILGGDGQWHFQADTACGRTIIGRSGGSIFPPDCKTCRRAGGWVELS